MGISPVRPDTGYGYIQYGKETEEGIYKVEQFREKPSLQKAQEYLSDGNYLWNAGIFIWKAKAIINALKKYTPDIYHLFESGREYYNTPEEQAFIDENYARSPNISIDYAIMEQADNIYTIPANFGWSDLGTWASLHETADKDSENNVVAAKQLNLKDTQNSIIHINTNKLAVIRGLDNFIVVDDGNALLIYPKDQEQQIKEVVKQMSESYGDRFI
ncbi:Alginate biosynthesis protein AlgA [compost metagenome]